ncbi:SRPBCC domain-containing protein [Actinokineospora sp. G85]|uniref:SRPBCC domain-containing protein n=1 Tax=Actinokineospora sp. G85 TaxID=3406626 RepID=UPI003C7193C5
MSDLDQHVDTARRETRVVGDYSHVLLARDLPAPAGEVWSALTDPDRISRWFLPVSGDLRVGGAFTVEGNAEGEVLVCEPDSLLRVTYGAPDSVVELRLSGSTTLELEHTVSLDVADGAGALYVGPGWDISMLWLLKHLDGTLPDDPVAAENSLAGQRYSAQAVHRWADTLTGLVAPDALASVIDESLAQYAPDLPRPA